jgi:hypothetical protein
MGHTDRFRIISLAVAIGSALLYWFVYADNRHITAEGRAARLATTMPIPLNGFAPRLQGVLPSTAHAGQTKPPEQNIPTLLIVVSDRCPGCSTVVPEWINWIRNSPNHNYSAVVVSVEGTNYLQQLSDAFLAKGIVSEALRVTQRQAFIRSSGVSATPTLLALDNRGRVRIVSGMFSRVSQHALEQFLDLEAKAIATR